MAEEVNVGRARFLHMMDQMDRVKWLVPGHEALTKTLTVAAIFGDDAAIAALHDLFEQHDMQWHRNMVNAKIPEFRKALDTWLPATRKTFLRHCREKGIFRGRTCYKGKA